MNSTTQKGLKYFNQTKFNFPKSIPETYYISERSNNSKLPSEYLHFRKTSDGLRYSKCSQTPTPMLHSHHNSSPPSISYLTNYNAEMQKALKFLNKFPQKSKPSSPKKRESLIPGKSQFRYLSHDEIEVKKFVDALFSKEISSYRRALLASDNEAVGFLSADKILQEAKRIMKNGIKKKLAKSELGIIEDFWTMHISKEKIVRWDIFEDNFLCYLLSYMVTDIGVLRKVNWKKFFQKLYMKISKETKDCNLWVLAPCYKDLPNILHRTISLEDWSFLIVSHEIVLLIFSCIDEVPSLPIKKVLDIPYVYACGCKYKGQWHDNRRQGVGLLEMCSKEIYDGIFNNELFQDFGTIFIGGFIYKGYFKKDRIHGFGKLLYPNGSFFEGVIDKGIIQAGSVKWADGRFYKGEFHSNNLEGKGKMRYDDGTVLDGMWHAGKLHGEGMMRMNNGKKFKGVFIDGELQGIGKIVCDEYKYVGDFVRSKPNGKGRFIYKDGSWYVGEVKDGIINGRGFMKYATGESFEGVFVDGHPGEADKNIAENENLLDDKKENEVDANSESNENDKTKENKKNDFHKLMKKVDFKERTNEGKEEKNRQAHYKKNL